MPTEQAPWLPSVEYQSRTKYYSIAPPVGEKPFRTTVDFIGMGDHVQKYNEHLAQVTTGLYTNFGIAGMLSVQ